MGPTASTPVAGFPPRGDVLAVDDEVASYVDLAVVAVLCGYWEPFVRGSAWGAHLAGAREVDEMALREAAEQFRRERDLVAAEELRAWLAARSVDRSEWQEALVRSVLLAADDSRGGAGGPGGPDSGGGAGGPSGPGGGGGLAGAPAPSPDDQARTIERLRVDAFCLGLWARSARQAVDWLVARRIATAPPATKVTVPAAPGALGPVAASPQAGPQPPAVIAASLSGSGVSVRAERVEAIASWRAAYDIVRARLSSDAGVGQTIRQRELDWTSFELEELVLGTETAAREALLCSRDDGMALGDIQRRSGGRVEVHRSRADELPPTVAAELLAAPVGTGVVGPVRHAQGWSVIWLRARHRPAVADEDVRQEAAGALLREALDRESVGHLRWLGPL